MDKSLRFSSLAQKQFGTEPVFRQIIGLSQELGTKTFLVGGALRDLFILGQAGKTSNWDFALNRDPVRFGRRLALRIKGAFVILDKTENIARVILRTPLKNYEIDLAPWKGKSLDQDLKQRDFTINTLAADIRGFSEGRGELIDKHGALPDIRKKTIRMVREKNFHADPLRILRAFAFAARFNFKLEKATIAALKKNSFRLKQVSAERISEELGKISAAGDSHQHWQEMDQLGIIKVFFPELEALRGLDQGQFHHLDAWGHSLETLKQLEKLLKNPGGKFGAECGQNIVSYLRQNISGHRTRLWILKLAALLHDLGKPGTRTIDAQGRIHFYTHEKLGAEIADKITRRLKFSRKESELLKKLIRFHLRAGQLVNRVPSRRAKFRFFRDLGQDAPLVLLLTIADWRAMRGPLSRKKEFVFHQEEISRMIAEFFSQTRQRSERKPLLDGFKIMKCLKISPGPRVGKIIRALEEAQALGQAQDKKAAEAFVKKLFADKFSANN